MTCIINSAFSNKNEKNQLADNLAESGHRDIYIVEKSNVLQVYYWPIGFRDDYKGFVDVKKNIVKFLPHINHNGIEFIEFNQTSWGIPTVTARVKKENIMKSINFIRKYYSFKKTIKNSSIFHPSKRLMLFFNIPLSVNFGQPFDPLVFKTGISSEFRFRLFQNIIAYYQFDFYFHNEYDVHEYYKPGNIGLMIFNTFKDHVISVTNIGAFKKDIYGINEELYVSLFDDKISFGFHGGYFGDLFYKKNAFRYRDIEYKLALFKLIYSIDTYDCKLEIKAGRFLYGDKGFGAEISRVFKEVEIGFTGIKTKEDIAANVFFSIPLFPKTRKSLVNYGIAPAKHFKIKYWYYSNKLGREPQISTSFKNIVGLSNPSHFEFMTKHFKDY